MVEADGRYRRGEFEARGQYAHGFLDGMSELNGSRLRTTGVNPNVAEQIRGFYLESSYFISPRPAPREVAVFVRYENFDTQYRMSNGFQPLKEFDRDGWVFGITYFPDPDVAVKLDYTVLRNQSDSRSRHRRFASRWERCSSFVSAATTRCTSFESWQQRQYRRAESASR